MAKKSSRTARVEQPNVVSQTANVSIVVTGDIAIDHVLVSNNPAPGKFTPARLSSPWELFKEAQSFTVPGGAWLSGHMIQAALARSMMTDTYELELEGSEDAPESIWLTATVCADTKLDHNKLLKAGHRFSVRLKEARLLASTTNANGPEGAFRVNQFTRRIESEGTCVLQSGKIERFKLVPTAASNATKIRDASKIRDIERELHSGGCTISSPIEIRDAWIEVIDGTAKVEHIVKHRGKLKVTKVSQGGRPNEQGDRVTLSRWDINASGAGAGNTGSLWIYDAPSRAQMSNLHVLRIHNSCRLFPRSHDSKRTEPKVFRRDETFGVERPESERLLNLSHAEWVKSNDVSTFRNASKRLVVVDDDGLGYANNSELWSPFLLPAGEAEKFKEINELLDDASSKQSDAGIEAHLTRLLGADDIEASLASTYLAIKCGHWIDARTSRLLRLATTTSLRERTILVVSGETLRLGLLSERGNTGMKLAKFVSWERLVEDFDRALRVGELRHLQDLKYIAVRLGLSGAILWCRNQAADGEHLGQIFLHYDKRRIEEEYADPEDLGLMTGLTTVFLSSIISSIYDDWSFGEVSRVNEGVKSGIQACRRYYEIGYGATLETLRSFERLRLPVTQVFSNVLTEPRVNPDDVEFDTFARRFRKNYGENDPNLLDLPWSILGQRLLPDRDTVAQPDETARQVPAQPEDYRVKTARKALEIGREIVASGARETLRTKRFPYREFGELLTVDRYEIEGLRSIRNLLREYLRQDEKTSPISIAVFGPPGSGKSFGVRQIAAEVIGSSRVVPFVFNLAQFDSFEQVTGQLLKVRDAGLEEKIPLVFFDEFDSRFDGRPLGWLKFFLAPMQDGKFQHGNSMLGLGKAILVFAGGTATRHAEFIDQQYWQREYTADSVDFSAGKVPDFHSRLRGFLDIAGINPVVQDNSSSPGEDFSFVIRRAIVLRKLIERRATGASNLLDAQKRLDIDGDVLDAFLATESYRHGIRSLESIVDMSLLEGHRQFGKSALPASRQYLMHVHESFRYLLLRQYSRVDRVWAEVME